MPDELAAAKRLLRHEMRVRRDALDDRSGRSLLLWSAVATLPEYVAARSVMAFASMRSEPDTRPFLDRAWAEGKTVVLPRVDDGEIAAVRVRPDDVLVPSAFGVPEPEGPAVDPHSIDLVIVPGLAFTTAGDRVGYGGGFYDRFLPRLRRGAFTVGVCFTEQVVDEVPHDEHDRRVDLVVAR